MSINQRLGEFLFEKKISQEQLRIKLGLKTRQQVSNWINCHDHIPDKHLVSIIRLFPELNANWLIRNLGNPFLDQQALRQINRNEYGYCEECLKKEHKIESQKSEIEELKAELKEAYIEIGKLKAHNEYNENNSKKKPSSSRKKNS